MFSTLQWSLSPQYFGAFPSETVKDTLLEKGVKALVDLTCSDEVLRSPAHTRKPDPRFSYLYYPLPDHGVPEEWSEFSCFVVGLTRLIRKGVSFYIHCRAGHGRSSLICAVLLCYIERLHPEESLARVTEMHHSREGLHEKWASIAHPLTRAQHVFLYKFFTPVFFSKIYSVGTQAGFSSLSPHAILFPDGTELCNSEGAYQYYLHQKSPEFQNKLDHLRNKSLAKVIGESLILPRDFSNEERFDVMAYVYSLKYEQHPELWRPLANTYLRTLFDTSKFSHVNNRVGEVLMKLREDYLLKFSTVELK